MIPAAAWILAAIPLGFLAYSYLVYPALLRLVRGFRPDRRPPEGTAEWPSITITVPCYNEARSIGATIERLLALDYPADRLQILVISDASTDGTDDIVRSFGGRGVELLRLPTRRGKTAAENAAGAHARGEIVVNTDATIRILPDALRPLVASFRDPSVGVASGRDVSVGSVDGESNKGESGYVGYEMWVRGLESRVWGIVGASGCFYAIRRSLYDEAFPEALSRDFASCLIAREHGYRSISVDAARALVPRSPSLRAEFRRKVRTMARGLSTLLYKRRLLDPTRFGVFSLMLFSHKLCRWLFQLTAPLLVVAACIAGAAMPSMIPWLFAAGAIVVGVAAVAWWWPEDRPMPPLLSAPGYFIWSNLAGIVAWKRFLLAQHQPTWEPTRRPAIGN